jgi:hypothetical protein
LAYLKNKSVILDSFLWSKLFQLSTRLAEDKDWFLIYRGTKDGFSATDFHRECDKIAKTVTIVKTTNGNIFGGYTDKLWGASSYGHQILDDNAFIFSLVNERNKPFIAPAKKNCGGIFACNGSYGPCFGNNNGYDIKIESNSDKNRNSTSHMGKGYQHKDYPCELKESEYILAGSPKFQTLEIEVFRIN